MTYLFFFSLTLLGFVAKSYRELPAQVLYHTRVDSLHLDSARQSKIEAERPIEEDHSRIGKADEEDRFYKVAASPNVKNLPACGITSNGQKQFSEVETDQNVQTLKHQLIAQTVLTILKEQPKEAFKQSATEYFEALKLDGALLPGLVIPEAGGMSP